MGLLQLTRYVDGTPTSQVTLGLALLTLSWDKNWDSHSLVNGYPSFYPRIALVAPSPGWSLSGTTRPPTMITLINIMVMNGWLTSFLFHVNRTFHSWDKAISDSDLETPKSRSWMWSKGKSYSEPSILLTRFLFISHQSDQQFLRYSYFEIWPWNIQGQGHEWGKKVKVTYCTQYPTDALPFRFTSIGQPFLRYGQNSFWPWRDTSEILKKIAKITIFGIIFSKI